MNHVSFIGQKGIPAEFIGTSGVEFYVEQKAVGLTKKRTKVSCYVRNWATPKQQTTYRGVKLIHIPTIQTKHFDALIHSLLSSIHVCFTDVDSVWYQAIGPSFFSFLPKIAGKKIIITIHGLDWKRAKWNRIAQLFLKLCEKIAVKNADKLIVVSDDLQTYYQTYYQKKSVVDTPIAEHHKKEKPNIITVKYGLLGNDYLLYMGRFVPEKRIEWIIEAYQKLHQTNLKLVLAGGASFTESYEQMLIKYAEKNPNIIFTGWVFGKEKSELLSNCRLFILASAIEGNPTVIKEIKLFGRPSVIPDNLKNTIPTHQRRNIFFFHYASRNDLYSTIKKCLM